MKENYPYIVKNIADGVYLINEIFSTMFVVVGDTSALVIDCGTGVGDFKSIVEGITDKPYKLIATHAHVDHIGGRGQFSDLYISGTDSEKIKSVGVAYRRLYALVNKFNGNSVSLKKTDIKKYKNEPAVHIVHEGDEFDLGGRKLTVYETPGHTNGSICLLDDKTRILFSGDVANPVLLMWLSNAATLKELVPTLERLYSLEGFDTMWACHSEVPFYREDIKKVLECAKRLAQKKNTLLPLIKTFTYDGIIIMYRSSHIS